MKDTHQTKQEILCLIDNRFDDLGEPVSREVEEVLSRYDGKTLAEWAELGVAVFPVFQQRGEGRDDESHGLSFFTLGFDDHEGSARTWINTGNCMGVVRLRDKAGGRSVQIEIGSRFDEGRKPFFLTYLLSRVFGGSIIDLVSLGRESLWDMLLAFVFRRRLLAAGAVGLFRQYRTFDHNDDRVRGRIDVDEHLRRNVPFCGRVAYATHEITFDNPTNHLIRHALAKVAREWEGWLTEDDRLTEVRHQLEQSTPTWKPGEVIGCIRRKENQTRIRHPYFQTVYEPLRQVSLAILRSEGASLYEQQQEAEGVIFDGSWLWEEYLWTLLKPLGFEHPENKRARGAWAPLDGVTLYPDFFHRGGRAVLDAKYRKNGVRTEEARQVFAYMFLLEAGQGGVIKPDGDQSGGQKIRRENKDPNPAFWQDLVLPPPSALTAGSFVDQMRKRETKFKASVSSLLGSSC